MALLDFLKKKKEAEKRPRGYPKADKKPGKVLVEKKQDKKLEETQVKQKEQQIKTRTTGFSYEAIKQPHISEKSTLLSEKDQYVFQVLPGYNKNEIKKSVEGIYGVNVLSVNIIKIPPKKRRLGRTEGFKKSYRKAVVKIKEGQKIEIL